jgi:phosphohistidine phosphatase
MPELLIMRHATAEWGMDVTSDRERPLSQRGVKDAKRAGRAISKIGAVPDLILSSPAVRARTTAEWAARAGRWKAPIEIVDVFYGGGWADVLNGVIAIAPKAERILVTGHEPTWSELVSVLTGGSLVAMPTAAVACVALANASWSSLAANCAELQWHLTPNVLSSLM